MDIDDFNKKQEFVRDAMPDKWLEYGTELRDAAELLWAHENEALRVGAVLDSRHEPQSTFRTTAISRPYILLSAFSIENLLKGILVAQNPSHISAGEVSKDVWGHNLILLTERISDLQLSQEQRELIRIAQDALPYWGRYPVPKGSNGLLEEYALDQDYRETFLALHSRLSKRIYDLIRDGWDSGVGPQIGQYRDVQFGDVIDMHEPL